MLSVNSNPFHMGQAMSYLINTLWLEKHTHLLTDASLLTDGFIEGFWTGQLFNLSHTTVLHQDHEDFDEISLFFHLRDLRENGVKQFVVHAQPNQVNLLMRANRRMEATTGRGGYRWFLSDTAMSGKIDDELIPVGALRVKMDRDERALVEHTIKRIFEEIRGIKDTPLSDNTSDCFRFVIDNFVILQANVAAN